MSEITDGPGGGGGRVGNNDNYHNNNSNNNKKKEKTNSGTGAVTTNPNNNNNNKRPTTSSTTTKSLVSLLVYLEGMEIIVELKTGKMYRGIVSSVDGNTMDLILENSFDIHSRHSHRHHHGPSPFGNNDDTNLSRTHEFTTSPTFTKEGNDINSDIRTDIVVDDSATTTTAVALATTAANATISPNITNASTTVQEVPTTTTPTTTTTTTASTVVCIRGPKIRYIHFPEDVVDLAGVIRTGMDREHAAKKMYERGKRKTR